MTDWNTPPATTRPNAAPAQSWPDTSQPVQYPNWGDTKPVETTQSATNPTPSSPYDGMTEDQLLLAWDDVKKAIETAKTQEMELRKYIVARAFPKKQEGMNSKELGNGYELKAAIKYNYNLADNETVENCLAKVASLGNQGPFIADRLVSWKPSFLLTEYRELQEGKEKGEQFAIEVLKAIEPMLTIVEAAPTLEIKEPKGKKK